jgi:8-amino-7-oxononanoate synthase
MLDQILQNRLEGLKRRGRYRSLSLISGAQTAAVTLDGKKVVQLSSNNYLDLASHPALKRAAAEALELYGCGAGASRLISGTMELHTALERKLAELKGTEAALVFSSGYHANTGIIPALVGPGDTIFSDALNHASIIDGCRLSRADVRVFRHRNTRHLEKLLVSAPPTGRRLIVTDTVFSMDGDLAPLKEVVALARRHRAWVMVDEAHATGVFGPSGAGVVEEMGLAGQVEIQMGTLGKALGSFGAYAAGSRVLIEWLINRARSFIYTTALPPPVLAAALAALTIVNNEPERRRRLWQNAAFLKRGLSGLGYRLGDTASPILPVLIGDETKTMALRAALLERGVFAQGIRPPTVAEGTARLRVTPMATHTEEELERALCAFAEAGKEAGVL